MSYKTIPTNFSHFQGFAWINVIFLPEAVPKDCQVDIKASVIKGEVGV